MLYRIECPDEATDDVNMRNQVPDTKLTNSNETDDDMLQTYVYQGQANQLVVQP